MAEERLLALDLSHDNGKPAKHQRLKDHLFGEMVAGRLKPGEMIFLMLPRLGLRVPEDVSLLSFGGAWREGALTRRLSSIVLDEVATGRQAVSLLNEIRNGLRPLDDNSEFIMELSLPDGETLGTPENGKKE